MKEYQQYLDVEGNIATGMKSRERKGWTSIPYCIPRGTVVTHAALNISSWIAQLVTKVNV